MATATLVRPAQTMRPHREPPRSASTVKRPMVNGDEPDHVTSKKRRLDEPFVRDSDYILEKHKWKPPSLIVHLHPTHFRFDGQDGSFAYDSPMRFMIRHLRKQTVPHEMLEELWAENVPFYDGCLIVEVHNHRTPFSGSERSKRVDSGIGMEPVKFSMHNYNDHVTPSPFVPYPAKAKEETNAESNDEPGQDNQGSKKNKDQRGPKITTLVLHPTALTRHHELLILANTPASEVRAKKKGDGPPGSSTANKNTSNQAQKMCLDENDFYSFQSDLLVATEPPLYLEPVKSLEESEQVLRLLANPLHNEQPPSPKTRKRTTAEMAADDAQAAEEERRMLIMDERIKPSGTGTSANDNQTAAASLGFSRFKTLEMVRQKHEEQERAKKEEEARLTLERKQNEEHAAQQKMLQANRQRELAQQVQQRQASLMMQNQQRPDLAMQQFADQQRQAQLARNDASQNIRTQAQAVNFHHQQQQAAAMSPSSRQQTPMVASSPMVRMAQTNSQGAGSPPRPPSAAMQHHNAAAMARQVSQQQHASQNNTPQMVQGTPNMAQAIPNRQMSQTPRMPPGSPASGMQGNSTPQSMVMQTPHMANAPSQFTPEQLAMLQTQRALSQVQSQPGMQSGSLPQGMTPEQIQNIRVQQQAQVHAKQQAMLQVQAAAQASGNPQLATQQAIRANMMRQVYQQQQMRQMQLQQQQQQQQNNGQAAGIINASNAGQGGMQVQTPQMMGNMPQTPLQQANMMAGQGSELTPQQQHAVAQAKAQQIQMHRQSQQQLQHLSQQYGGWMNIPQNVVTTLNPQMQLMLRQQAQKQQFLRQQHAQRAQQQLQQGGGDQQVPAGQPNPQYMQALRSNQAMLMQAQAQMRQSQQQQHQQQNGGMNGMGVNMNMANMGGPGGFGGGQPGADLNQHFANMQNALNPRAGQQGMNGGGGQ